MNAMSLAYTLGFIWAMAMIYLTWDIFGRSDDEN